MGLAFWGQECLQRGVLRWRLLRREDRSRHRGATYPPARENEKMSFEGMDPKSEMLEAELGTSGVETEPREWPGVSRASAPAKVQFPGEDGGRSLAKMAQSDLDAALQLLAERAHYITGATGAAIALRDGEEVVCRASAGGRYHRLLE